MIKNKKGFTLVELLVVVAIIGLLSTLAVVALGNARQKARDAKRVSDIKQVQTALELYFSDVGSYPVQAPASALTLGAGAGLTLSSGAAPAGFAATASATTYMALVPANPTPGGAIYAYTSCGTAPCSTYSLTFELENTVGGLASGAHTATPSGVN